MEEHVDLLNLSPPVDATGSGCNSTTTIDSCNVKLKDFLDMFSKEVGYEAVRTIASQEDLEESTPFSDQDEKTDTESTYSRRPKKYAIGRIWPWMSLEVNTLLLGTAIWQYSCLLALRSPLPPYPDLVYSPAQHLIEYEQVEFVDGLRFLDGKPRSIYLGPPTDESDAAWNELYDIGGINQIPASEAAKLLEPTAKVLDEPGYHFVGLDVFHQLHCLNWVRKMLRPERYGWSMDGLTEEQKAERFIHHGESLSICRSFPKVEV